MNYSLSKFGDFRRFESIFNGCFDEEQKLSENQKTVKTVKFHMFILDNP